MISAYHTPFALQGALLSDNPEALGIQQGQRLNRRHGGYLGGLSTHIFRVSLKPRLYRDIEIKSDESLAELAEVIVKAFHFNFDHPYGFFSAMKGNVYKSPVRYELFADVDGGREARSVKRTKIGDAFALVGSKMLFLFDYGDEWRFKVEVIDIGQSAPKGRYPKIRTTVGKAPDQYPDLD